MAKATANPRGAEVFISYAQDEDAGPALEIADRLQLAGATVWIAERSIDGAQNYAQEIVAAIDECKVVIVLCSAASMQSRHVATELDLAFEAGRHRLPLLLDRTVFPAQIRYWLAGANQIDISGPTPEWMPKVLRALSRLGVSCEEAAAQDLTESAEAPQTGSVETLTDEQPDSPMGGTGAHPTKLRDRKTAAPRPSALVQTSRAKARRRGTGEPAQGVEADGVATTTCYRTPGIASGYFRTPGDIHAHIDGANNVSELFDLLKDLGEPADGHAPFPGKFNHILRFSGGPQRDDRAFAETYRHHTPGSAQKETFDSFSTIWLGSGADLEPDAVAALRRVIASIADQPAAVVELERVIGILDTDGDWDEADPPRVADPRSLDTPTLGDFRRLNTSSIEIHHSIDIPKESPDLEDAPLVSVDELPTWPHLGGWFLFDKGESWSYRSSEFVGRTGEYHYAACVGQRRLYDFFEELGQPYELHTLVEQVLGIWRGGPQPKDDRLSISALGQWEISCPPNGHVWVIAANFLGDRSPDVQRAMLQNLGDNVTYTYFLRTHAGLLRLELLAEELERGLVASGASGDKASQVVEENVRCVLLSTEVNIDDRLRTLLEADYFLFPHEDDLRGYKLVSSGLSGERMSEDDAQFLVGALSPLITAKVGGVLFSSEESSIPKTSYQAVVCTDLEETGAEQDQKPWLKMLGAYDHIVAREVSVHGKGCFVVRPVRNGYLLVFEQARKAAEWAKRLQFEVRRYNQELARSGGRGLPIPEHNIAIGYGSVSRVLRAHGQDYIGGAIDDCIDLAAKLRDGLIAMSNTFAGQYEGDVGKHEFQAGTRPHPDIQLHEVRLLDWP